MDFARVQWIKAKALVLGMQVHHRKAVKKEDLERYEKYYQEIHSILGNQRGTGSPMIAKEVDAAKALEQEIEATLKYFKENFHLDAQGYYVNAEGKRA